MNNAISLYQKADGTHLDVRLDDETVWLSQKQMAALFDKNVRTVNEHIKNIFAEGELDEPAVIRNFRITAADGKSYETAHYNLDVIISVGYRVKSQQGTCFRQWATRVLRTHIVDGCTLNEQPLREESAKLRDMRQAMDLLARTLTRHELVTDIGKDVLKVIDDYAYALAVLDRYDHGTLAIEGTSGRTAGVFGYDDGIAIVAAMKTDFNGLFGIEKDQGFKSALGAIYQTFNGQDLYPSVEEKAANLLYLTVKNQPSATATSASPPPCSSPSWPAPASSTAPAAASAWPTMPWSHSPC